MKKSIKNSSILIEELKRDIKDVRSLLDYLYKRDYSNYSDAEFEETVINGVNWDEICMLRLKDPSVKNFHDTIHFHLDEMAPLKKVTLKQYRLMIKPWITNDALKKCDERNNLLELIKEESDTDKILCARNIKHYEIR